MSSQGATQRLLDALGNADAPVEASYAGGDATNATAEYRDNDVDAEERFRQLAVRRGQYAATSF